MASTPPAVRRARRSLIVLLVIIAALVGVISLGVFRGEATWTPKLALDLQGGTQIILAPKQTDGQSVTGEQLQQAVSIIRQRVDASGVSEAEITTQGNQNIIVSIPGKADEATLARIEASAKMDMRAVLQVAAATSAPQTETDAADDTAADDTAADDAAADGTAADAEAADSGAADGTDAAADADTAEGDLGPRDPDPLPTNPSDTAWLTPALLDEFNNYVCGPEAAQEAGLQPLDRPLVTCDVSMTQKYILAPAEQSASGEVLGGESITDAVAQQRATSTGASTGEWEVALRLDSEGTELFGQMSTRLYGAQSPLNQFAFVLDGSVLIAPSMNGQILDGRPAISGNYTVESAKLLADQLKFGALPIGFTVQSQEDISATLGANQLQAGLLAGLIGLLLVVIYSIFQYRALGSVTILSLAIAGVLTYLLLTLFSWRQGYRLSLAGIAGIIVAVGFTADSFIVYFERIRDALRDGFSIDKSVEHGWKRAFRTVLASDGINFLAALILFLFAVGSVQGFAFTLGLTTLVDVLVVALFTHPVVTLLARTRFYRNGHPASGLDPERLGAVYRGRAQFRAPVIAKNGAGKKAQASHKEAQRRQTIAERKAAESEGTPVPRSASTGKES